MLRVVLDVRVMRVAATCVGVDVDLDLVAVADVDGLNGSATQVVLGLPVKEVLGVAGVGEAQLHHQQSRSSRGRSDVDRPDPPPEAQRARLGHLASGKRSADRWDSHGAQFSRWSEQSDGLSHPSFD